MGTKRAKVLPGPLTDNTGVTYTFEWSRKAAARRSYGLVAVLSGNTDGNRHSWGLTLNRRLKQGGVGSLLSVVRKAECAAGHHVRGRCKTKCLKS